MGLGIFPGGCGKMDNVHEMAGFDFWCNTIYFALKGTLSKSFTCP